MSWRPGADDVDEEDLTEYPDQVFDTGRECSVFLIDCDEAMFKANDSGEIPFNNAVSTCIDIISTKLINRDDDLVGVCLYTTRETKGLPNYDPTDNIYALIQVDNPDPSMLTILEKINAPEGYKFGHCPPDQVKWEDALWFCSHMFSSAGQKISNGRVFIFTVNESPNCATIQAAKTRVEDLEDNNIFLEPFFLRSDFNVSKFYDQIITIDRDEDPENVPDRTMSNLQLLRNEVRRKQVKKRAVSSIEVSLGEARIAVKVYNMITPATKPYPIKLNQATNEPVVSRTTYVCQNTGDVLMSEQMGLSQKFGGRTVVFDKDEVSKMKKFGDPSVKILGFKPRTAMKAHHSVKHSSMIYPDEAARTGSDTAFAALLEAMNKRDVVAIASVVPKGGMQSRLAALYPQKEKTDHWGRQTLPSCLQVVWLPFADDIRKLPIAERSAEATPSATDLDAASKVIDVLTFRQYDPFEGYTNPDLQTHYAALQAVAMNKDEMEKIKDDLEPEVEHFKAHAGDIAAFGAQVLPPSYDFAAHLTKGGATSAGASKKRARDKDEGAGAAPAGGAGSGAESGSRPSKKGKNAASAADVVGDPAAMKEMVESGKHSSFTRDILKQFLQSQGVKVKSTAKKGELVEMVAKWAGK